MRCLKLPKLKSLVTGYVLHFKIHDIIYIELTSYVHG
jgi:hypothetical protein